MQQVAQYRGVTLVPLRPMLVGYPDIAQSRWLALLRKQRLDAAAPVEFSIVVEVVTSFADRVIVSDAAAPGSWDPLRGTWI